MAKKPLSNYSKDELEALLKKNKMYFGIFIGLITVMVIVSFLSIFSQKISFNTFMPLFFIPMLFVYHKQVKEIEKEMSKRE